MELYKKHRPDSLKKIIGNKETVKALTRMIEEDDVPHAILITGPRGTGKTTLGRILKKELNCDNWDYKELDTAVFRGKDTAIEIKNQMVFKPVKGDCKIWLLDEFHQFGANKEEKNIAQNALLKALEDTPKHVYFILCTTNPEMVIKTVKSRCTEFKMDCLSDKEMESLLTKVSKKEKKKIPGNVIKQITKASEGHPRNALQLLGKIIHLNPKTDEKEMLKLSVAENIEEIAQVNELVQALLNGNSWDTVRKILLKMKQFKAEDLRRNIIRYSSAVLLNGNDKASLILGWFLYKNTYELGEKDGFALVVQFCWNIVNEVEPNC